MGKRVGLLAGLVVLALGNGAVAQEPMAGQSPIATPPFAGAVEMPERGIVVTIPQGWVGLDPGGDLDGQLAMVEGWPDEAGPPTPTDGLQQFWETSRRGNVPMLLATLDVTQSVCVIQPTAQLPPDTVVPRDMLEPLVRSIHTGLLADDLWTDVGELVTVPLPLGDAWVVTSTEVASGLAQTSYWVGHREGILWVLCQSVKRPQDDWLSIAGAIEFLPPEE